MMLDLAQFSALAEEEYCLYDLRGERSYAFGHIPHAEVYRGEETLFPEGKKLVFYCRTGERSAALASSLCERGLPAYALEGGYENWLAHGAGGESGRAILAEESLRGRFHARLFSPFARAIVTYRLLRPGDRVAVCISGGKDSMLMAKLFQEIARHHKFGFELVFLVMDPGYSPEVRAQTEENLRLLGIPALVFETNIFASAEAAGKSPCYLCARMRRGHLYAKAKELGCNKIALGHHYDDVIETILMGMLYGGQVQTMLPRIVSANFEGMELIRPMYFVREEDIEAWRDANGLSFIRCACRMTAGACGDSKRQRVKELIRLLRREDKGIEQNIFKSVENVNLATLLSYKDRDGAIHPFDELLP